jgi:CubicO group peptidase (beta-lactamase class C family)
MATAQDWARFGQLYVEDGAWQGRRLLPEGWLDYALTPAPADDEPVYGGAFLWLGDRVFSEIADVISAPAVVAFGHYGQRTIILPEQEIVVVRMGQAEDDVLLLEAVAAVLATVD